MDTKRVGAYYEGSGTCVFTVWAPLIEALALHIHAPHEKLIPLEKDSHGYWSARVHESVPGMRYSYRVSHAVERPDPASFFQPEGVHQPSAVIDHLRYAWSDTHWQGIPFEDMIIYELHAGTFTPEGTCAGIITKLDYLLDLGINTIELMPVAQFPGGRNWGYDGTYPFAVQNSYGGPDGLKQLVDACHAKGIAVILDVVYNHSGPEGNYLRDFGPYFTQKYKTPWGDALNFDDAYSYGVRNYFIQNMLYWFREYHIDGLRLDAIHGIFDMSAKHILRELAEGAAALSHDMNRTRYLIAESDLNDARIIEPRERGGYGIHAQWSDDFHHSVHTLLTAQKTGYYEDFGLTADLATALQSGFVYSGKYSPHRKRYHGNSSALVPAYRFVVSIQNHDQIGNRMSGERLCHLISFEAAKLAAGILICSPNIPLFFMGEEWAANSPFLYFVSHTDPALVNSVRQGRKEEFRSFGWKEDPPDPQSEETFRASQLVWKELSEEKHKVMFDFYRQLITYRKEISAFREWDKRKIKIEYDEKKKIICMERGDRTSSVYAIMNLTDKKNEVNQHSITGRMAKVIDSADARYSGPGSSAPETIDGRQRMEINPFAFILYGSSRISGKL